LGTSIRRPEEISSGLFFVFLYRFGIKQWSDLANKKDDLYIYRRYSFLRLIIPNKFFFGIYQQSSIVI